MGSTRLDVLFIGFYYEPDQTGIAPYAARLARGMVGRGHRVRAVVGYPHYPEWRLREGYGGLRRSEVLGGVEVTRVRHPVPRRSSGVGRIGMELVYALHAALVRGRRPDVVVAFSPSLLGALVGLTWRRRGRTALGVVVQDIYSRAMTETGAGSSRAAGLVGRLEGALLAKADGVAVIHETFRDVASELGARPEAVTVIRNWTHVTAPSSDTDRPAIRARLGWTAEETIALHAGNMGEKQGLENLVEAARLADEQRLPVRFVLLGHGSRREALLAAAAGVERIQFVEPLPSGEFEDAMHAADILVLNEKPGIAEMCVPSKLTSYFAAGQPVVAAVDPRSASATEVHRSGAGTCVPSGDPAALLSAVLSTAADEPGCAAAGVAGRRYAQEALSESVALDAYERWIGGLAALGGDRSAEPGTVDSAGPRAEALHGGSSGR